MARRMSPTLILTLAIASFVAPALAAETYQVDPVHSTALFRVKHLNTSYFNGRFADLSGTVVYEKGNPSASSVEIEISAESVTVKSDRQEDHLRSPDFFSAAQFPVLSFKSTNIDRIKDNLYRVAGELTIRGVTKPITVEVEKVGESDGRAGQRIGFSTSFEINRRDFNVNYGTDDAVGDNVKITLDIEAIKQ